MDLPPHRFRGSRVVLLFLAAVVLLALAYYGIFWHFSAAFRRQPPLIAQAAAGEDSGRLAQRLGLPPYPGARAETSRGDMVLGQNAVELRFLTPDGAERVMDFYHQHFPDAELDDEQGETWLVQWVGKDHFAIHALREAGETTIMIALLPS